MPAEAESEEEQEEEEAPPSPLSPGVRVRDDEGMPALCKPLPTLTVDVDGDSTPGEAFEPADEGGLVLGLVDQADVTHSSVTDLHRGRRTSGGGGAFCCSARGGKTQRRPT